MDDNSRATRAAKKYLLLGLSPLPSSRHKKMPTLSEYAVHQREPIFNGYLDDWGTPNIQLMCGVKAYGPRKIIVVDCDGDRAVDVFERMCLDHGFGEVQQAWVCRTGSGGRHIYLSLPEGTTECHTGMIWGLWDTYGPHGKGGWAKHQEVKILGDGALAVAPPSIHVDTGQRYAFTKVNPSSVPPIAPDWLLVMPRLTAPRFTPAEPKLERQAVACRITSRFLDRNAVLDSVHDKLGLAVSWGLRVAAATNHAGWCSCYAVGREDRNPSASFDAITGAYQDRLDMSTVSLFDLGVMLGRFDSWQECRDWCGTIYLGSSSPNPYRQAMGS